MMAAFQDISSNPMNIGKYKDNPKVQQFIQKMATKMGGPGAAGMGGMFGGAGTYNDTSHGVLDL